MYHSGEIRWFYPGGAPADLQRWIAVGDLGTREPWRIDEYLFLPGCDGTGVKLREGRFEIKARTSEPQPVACGKDVEGLRDGWVKWSRQAADSEALRRLVGDPRDDWMFVGKERRLRKFALEDGSIREFAGIAEMPPQGFQVELSTVRAVAGKLVDRAAAAAALETADAWWSLSLESFGSPDVNLANVETCARYLFAEVTSVALERCASMPYPAWLRARHRNG